MNAQCSAGAPRLKRPTVHEPAEYLRDSTRRPAVIIAGFTHGQEEMLAMSKEKETPAQRHKRKLDEELDRQLEQTFPASDPLRSHGFQTNKSRRSPKAKMGVVEGCLIGSSWDHPLVT
jgi:hypothetical protein